MDMSAISSEKLEAELREQLWACAYTMGVFLGDGNLHAYTAQKNGKWYPLQCVRFGKPDLDSLERVQQEIETVFGKRYALMKRKLESGLDFHILHAYRRDIFDFFAVNTANKTKIPDPYFSAPEAVRQALISGLMDSDGYVSYRETPHRRWEVGFGNSERDLVAGLASLLRGLGVKVGGIGEYQKGEYRLMYRINPNVRSFVEAGCNFYAARKASKLSECLSFMLGSETLYAAPSP